MLKELAPLNSHDGYYSYNENKLTDNFERLSRAFKSKFQNFDIAYSYKTNYTPYVCKQLKSLGAIAEVVSDMELDLALKLGYNGERIIYNGPYKSKKSLEKALLNNVTIHIDSFEELSIIEKLILVTDYNVNIGIRVNIDIENGNRSRFGIDHQSKEFKNIISLILKNSKISLIGIHCHLPYRNLNSFRLRAEKIIEICNSIEIDFEYIDLGGGFLGPINKKLEERLSIKAISFEDYASEISNVFIEKWIKNKIPKLIIEPGSALVANVFDFYCKAVSIKSIGNKNIVTLTGSKFNILPTAKKTFNLPIEILSVNKSESIKNKIYDLCGYTCIEDDILYESYEGVIEVNDIIKFSNVGSYSIVLKPPFILPNYPIILFGKSANDYKVLKEAEDFDYIFEKFNFFV